MFSALEKKYEGDENEEEIDTADHYLVRIILLILTKGD
jgi:hypothetical protein